MINSSHSSNFAIVGHASTNEEYVVAFEKKRSRYTESLKANLYQLYADSCDGASTPSSALRLNEFLTADCHFVDRALEPEKKKKIALVMLQIGAASLEMISQADWF